MTILQILIVFVLAVVSLPIGFFGLLGCSWVLSFLLSRAYRAYHFLIRVRRVSH